MMRKKDGNKKYWKRSLGYFSAYHKFYVKLLDLCFYLLLIAAQVVIPDNESFMSEIPHKLKKMLKTTENFQKQV